MAHYRWKFRLSLLFDVLQHSWQSFNGVLSFDHKLIGWWYAVKQPTKQQLNRLTISSSTACSIATDRCYTSHHHAKLYDSCWHIASISSYGRASKGQAMHMFMPRKQLIEAVEGVIIDLCDSIVFCEVLTDWLITHRPYGDMLARDYPHNPTLEPLEINGHRD